MYLYSIDSQNDHVSGSILRTHRWSMLKTGGSHGLLFKNVTRGMTANDHLGDRWKCGKRTFLVRPLWPKMVLSKLKSSLVVWHLFFKPETFVFFLFLSGLPQLSSNCPRKFAFSRPAPGFLEDVPSSVQLKAVEGPAPLLNFDLQKTQVTRKSVNTTLRPHLWRNSFKSHDPLRETQMISIQNWLHEWSWSWCNQCEMSLCGNSSSL